MSERECRTFEKKLAHFTAPTLLGIKCASLVSLSREEFDIPAYAAAFNAQAVRGGLQMQIMCRCQKRQLVLLYRPKLLQKRLEQPEIRRFLLRYGYTADMDLAACLMRLQNPLRRSRNFPMRSEFFWGTLWKMWTALSRIRGRTASCAVVGKCTETWNRHAGHLPAMRSAEDISVQS